MFNPTDADDDVPALVARLPKSPSQVPRPPTAPPMAHSGAETKAAMERVSSNKSIENRIMNDGGRRFEPQPSERNAAAYAVFTNADLTFSRVGGDFANSAYMRSRRPPGQ